MPSIACVASGTAAPPIQKPLATGVKAEESEHSLPIRHAHGLVTANQLVVGHTSVDESHCSPRSNLQTRSESKSRSEDKGVEQVVIEPHVLGHATVVERTRQRRDEIDVSSRSSLQEAASRNLDRDLDLRRRHRIHGRNALGAGHRSHFQRITRPWSWIKDRSAARRAACIHLRQCNGLQPVVERRLERYPRQHGAAGPRGKLLDGFQQRVMRVACARWR
jgi:hypothetical protein